MTVSLLSQLSPRQAEVVGLRYADDLTEAEAAERLNISERRVRYLMAAARDRLARRKIELPVLRRGRRPRTSSASQIGTREAPMNLATL